MELPTFPASRAVVAQPHPQAPAPSPPHHTNWGQQGSECSAMMEPSRLFSLLAGEPCIAQGAEQEPAAGGSRVAELQQRQALAYEL